MRLPRIPKTLQAVFLASNRGKEVNRPPPGRVASKVFVPRWLRGKESGGKNVSVSTSDTSSEVSSSRSSKSPRNTGGLHIFGKRPKNRKAPGPSPQSFLDLLIRSRGYSTMRVKSLRSAYCCRPTELQKASYGSHLCSLVRDRNVEAFREMMNCGISPNPCNNHGESLLHSLCRQGDYELFMIMMEAGATVQLADDCGRTPLHHACRARKPCFEIIAKILEEDVRLLHVTDNCGAVPLSYVAQEYWAEWVAWLDSMKETFWPPRDIVKLGEQKDPPLAELPPNARVVPDPVHALTIELAEMVVNGRINPDEARCLRRINEKNEQSLYLSCFQYDDLSESEGSVDEDEIADFLANLSVRSPRKVRKE